MSLHAPVILDIAGTELNADDRRRLKHPLTGGVIFFARNWSSRQQLQQLCDEIKAIRSDLLLCVDQEGGRVQRFKSDGFTRLPPMRSFGDLWMQKSTALQGEAAMGACDAATACGFVLGSELRAVGVDFSFAPVLDLDHGPSGVIGDRAFHRDPRVTALLARSLMLGLLQAGMAHCAKHFPGHGFVRGDSHTGVPRDHRSLTAILADDAKPYEWTISTLTSVMPAHVIYPKVDDAPAGFSKRWLQEILRRDLGFTGAIFSDDLSMEGASVAGSHTEGAVAALKAGCDLVLLCNQSLEGGSKLDAMLDGLASALEKGRWQRSAQSEVRRRALLPSTPRQAWNEMLGDPRYLQALSKLP